jgi:hypothetical protein
MGITVIGGLILSTVLTLVMVPALFSLAVGLEQWLGPRLSRRLLTYKPGDDGSRVIGQSHGGGSIDHKPGDDSPQPAE